MFDRGLSTRGGVQPVDEANRAQALKWLAFLEIFEAVPDHELALLLNGAQWVSFERGEVVMDSESASLAVYFLRNGSFSAWPAWTPQEQGIMTRVAPGDLIGALGALSGVAAPLRVLATRDSIALRVPEPTFVRFLEASHRGLLGVIRHLNRWVLRLARGARPDVRKRECSVIALVAVSEGLPLESLAREMATYLVKQSLAVDLVTPHNRPANSGTLSAMEAVSDVLFFVTSPADLEWTGMAIANCDQVVLLQAAHARELPEPDITRLCGRGHRPTVDLVLVHPADATGTIMPERWAGRDDIVTNLHIRDGDAADVHFLARVLVGRAVGMVFAGGGARGFAHLGVVKAFQEAGIPIDMTGGTSMGAIIGAGVACQWNIQDFLERLHQLFAMSSPMRDYTLPLVSVVRGRLVTRRLKSAFGDLGIERMWRPFFCVSSDLTLGRSHVHRAGPLWRALRASSALPGILPPVIADGHVLVDGAITNNFPVDVMREMARGCVIGSNVRVDAKFVSTMENIESMSTWRLMRDMRNGPVNIFSVMSRTATISSMHQTHYSRGMTDYLVESVSDDVSLLDWKSLHRVVDRAYQSTAALLERDGVTYASLLGAVSAPNVT